MFVVSSDSASTKNLLATQTFAPLGPILPYCSLCTEPEDKAAEADQLIEAIASANKPQSRKLLVSRTMGGRGYSLMGLIRAVCCWDAGKGGERCILICAFNQPRLLTHAAERW